MTGLTDGIEADCLAFIGRSRRQADDLPPERARQMQALLDEAPSLTEGQALPPLWHWLYFQDAALQAHMGYDGHEVLGRSLPPMPYARRMWAGSRMEVFGALQLGVPAEKHSTIRDVRFRTGSTGPLGFVDVDHAIWQRDVQVIVERQTIVYRDRGAPEPMPEFPADPGPGYFAPDIRLLFRYSALTYNGHRIHYDRDFCRDTEGYPGLVVHGPLMATLLARAAIAGGGHLRSFEFRALAPVFEGLPIRMVQGEGARPAVAVMERADGVVAMKAEMTWADVPA